MRDHERLVRRRTVGVNGHFRAGVDAQSLLDPRRDRGDLFHEGAPERYEFDVLGLQAGSL